MIRLCLYHKNNGFSLIEILAVLFLIGLMFSICIPVFFNINSSFEMHSSSNTIRTILRTTRRLAITKNAEYLTDFDKDSCKVSITDINGNQEGKTFYLPKKLFFDNTLVDIHFFPTGRAIKFGGGAAIDSIWIARKNKPEIADQITVTATTGRIKLRKNQKNL